MYLFNSYKIECKVRISPSQNLIYHNYDIWRLNDLYGWRHYENAKTKINAGKAGIVNFISDENGFRVNVNQKNII